MKKRGKVASELVGRRTGKRLLQGKCIRKLDNGVDMFEDYFSDSSNESKMSKKSVKESSIACKSQKIFENSQQNNSISDENNMEVNTSSNENVEQTDPVSKESDAQINSIASRDTTVLSEAAKNQISDRTLVTQTPVRKSKKTSCNTFNAKDKEQRTRKSGDLRKKNQSDRSCSSFSEIPGANFGEPSLKRNAGTESLIVTRSVKRNAENFETSKTSLGIIKNWDPAPCHTPELRNRDKINMQKGKHQHQKIKSPAKSAKKQSVKRKVGKKATTDSASGIRSSTRLRCAPLEFWRNERLLYRFTESGGIESLGLQPGTKNYCTWDFANKHKPNKEKKKKSITKKHSATHPVNSVYKNGIDVLDSDTSQEVKAQVIIPYNSLVWKKPDPTKHLGGFSISKTFDTKESTFGFIRIQGLKKKPTMSLVGYDAAFVIIKGILEVTIHHTTMILQEEDTFLVPCGNAYSLQNLESTEAILTFMATVHSFFHELKL